MKTNFLICTCIIGIALCGCRPPADPSADKKNSYEGREDTKSLRAADAVGYDGTLIQQKLDGALNQNDQRGEQLNQQIDAQTGGEPTGTNESPENQ